MSDVQPLTERDREALDPRVSAALHEERIAPSQAIAERVAEAEQQRNGGNQ